MFRTQIYLTKVEKEKLSSLVKTTGKHQSALIREAIDLFIDEQFRIKQEKKGAIEAAAGMWSNRNDLPDFEKIRREFDR